MLDVKIGLENKKVRETIWRNATWFVGQMYILVDGEETFAREKKAIFSTMFGSILSKQLFLVESQSPSVVEKKEKKNWGKSIHPVPFEILIQSINSIQKQFHQIPNAQLNLH